MDQAGTLRSMVGNRDRAEGRDGSGVRVIAVTSGKGGVGKTNVVANLAFALASLNQKKVLVLDADLGLGNLDILLGLAPRHNLTDVIAGRRRIHEIIVEGPGGMKILPASSGVQEVTDLSTGYRANLLTQLDELEQEIDYLLIDTAAGISSNVTFFTAAANEIVVVTSPEPTAITDAYALMKVMSRKYGASRFQLLVNSVKSEMEAKGVYGKLNSVADRFLNITIHYLGFIQHDPTVAKAVREQRAIAEKYPGSPASLCFKRLARQFLQKDRQVVPDGNIKFFWKRIFQVA
ncbi:MAG: MinD/ParA family protein [bacterium]|nr:MinD/ParA family protein [bacterium]